jgi:hypothetical protein
VVLANGLGGVWRQREIKTERHAAQLWSVVGVRSIKGEAGVVVFSATEMRMGESSGPL